MTGDDSDGRGDTRAEGLWEAMPRPAATATDQRAAAQDRARGPMPNGYGPPLVAGTTPTNGDRSTGATVEAEVSTPPPIAAAPARSRAKRALDLTLTSVVLPFAGIFGLLVAVLVATTSRGPVLFLQKRVGLGGQTFRMVKFRTMQVDAEERLRADAELWEAYVDNDFKLPAESDPRLTTVGRWLRRWSLDELPQVLNVLTGSMSWVGPRPVTPDQLEDWGPEASAYLTMRPGITGWWQINGRSDVQSLDRVAYDRDYADRWTFWLDVRILLRTPMKVLRGKGAF